MSAGEVVELGEDDLLDGWELGRLAFGVGPDVPAPTWPRPGDSWGVRDGRGRLVAKASLLTYEQWWGGRTVPMGGVAGVAVHPDARGQGLASRVVGALLPVMRERGLVVSALYPTVVGLYRGLGWEVVGALDETVLRTGDLRGAREVGAVSVRTAERAEAPALFDLYTEHARAGAGLLSRTGRLFPDGPEGAFEVDVLAVAEGADGGLRGYVSYDRGGGYRESAELTVHELVASDRAAAAALLASVGGWHPVAPATRWRGSTGDLGLRLPSAVPPPQRTQPWMLRIVDPVGAVAARGWAADVDVAFTLVDGGRTGGWRLLVRDGHGTLEPGPGGPSLDVRGLALLYAGAATTAALRRNGLLDGPLPGLDAACAGPRPDLLDYF